MTPWTPDRATPRLLRLPESGCVALSDLAGPEQWLVRTLRTIAVAYAGAYAARTPAQSSPAGLTEAEPALQRFVEAACDDGTPCRAPALTDTLSNFEAHVLHAVACLQSGLLGEAWKTLAQVCTSAVAGRALQPLEEVAAALARTGRRLERWHLDDVSLVSRA